MAKINKLPKELCDLIAAGEVVERPASVVKELVENAIDAGSKSVSVEIQRGGIKFIRVSDDGCGIESEDISTAFLSHATSKISEADDLNHIMTLGFRGEALPSIAAVSRVTLITKTADSNIGTSFTIEGGEVKGSSEAGCAQGTTIIVRDLFYNTPARMKFLKKDVSEGNYVASVVEKAALSHPEISFRFIRDGNQVLTTVGDGNLRNVCFSAFGNDFSKDLIDVKDNVGDIAVHGLITQPYNSRGSRGMQFVFVNGRSIKSPTIVAALENAYKNTVMVGRFPGCVLFLDVNPLKLDVNVHPAKTEVRFSDEKSIFDAVYYSVKNAISKSQAIKEIDPFKKTPSPGLYDRPREEFKQTVISTGGSKKEGTKNTSFEENKKYRDILTDISDKADEEGIEIDFPVLKTEEKKEEVITEDMVEKTFRILGEAFRTYIFVEKGDKLFVIDKHAAHERINFNKIRKNSANAKQILMNPATVTLSQEEYTAVIENTDLISEAGFDISDFGNGSVIVRSCPMDLDRLDIAPLISEIAGYLLKNRNDIRNEHLDWIYHNVACRSAVKAGDINDPKEIEELVNAVLYDDEVRFCPHGRPVITEITKNELEKQFGRIQ
ncbi:MAG: DNA mismatch repair endonuclease MutL [Clostridiales bacterium]|nr:DNA mismatch repair endonuclease MutL [Clostridiales bacterium]